MFLNKILMSIPSSKYFVEVFELWHFLVGILIVCVIIILFKKKTK